MQGFASYFCPYYYAGGFEHLAQDIPNELINVPLEITYNALSWSKVQPYVNDKVGLFGASRGAERALFLASKDLGESLIDATVVISPSFKANVGFSKEQADSIKNGIEPEWVRENIAWTFNGDPIIDREKVNIGDISAPILYFYFTPDPIWEETMGEESIKEELSKIGEKVVLKHVGKDQSIALEIEKEQRWTGVQFNFSGHSFVNGDLYPKLLIEQKILISKFFKTHLDKHR